MLWARYVGYLALTPELWYPILLLGLGLASWTTGSLTDSASLDPKPMSITPILPATLPAEVAETQRPPEDLVKVSSGIQQGAGGSGPRPFSDPLWFFQNPVPGQKKSKGMRCI